jgi:hypothetical protein
MSFHKQVVLLKRVLIVSSSLMLAGIVRGGSVRAHVDFYRDFICFGSRKRAASRLGGFRCRSFSAPY